ncbi:MAG: metallophosphoesterase [Verrucomicrobiota bacterium]|nr:metallophosphoesterase [Verrucomicrobiota bacterium]
MMLPRRCHPRSVIGQALMLVLVLGLAQSTLADRVAYQSSVYPTFADWKSACTDLPANRTLLRQAATTKLETALPDFEEVAKALLAAFESFKTGSMESAANWVGAKPKVTEFFNTNRAYFLNPPIPFQPFAQKLQVPAGSEVIYHGDFHGDIHSFIAMLASLNQAGTLDGFRLAKPNSYMVFLGDYTDRGNYGIEVLYTLLRLKLANPEHVFMARGNHEDVQMISTYGFLAECQKKYATKFKPALIGRLYDFFPVVIYVGSGTDFIQCNHGGMEPGYLPGALLDTKPAVAYQLLGQVTGGTFLAKHPGLLQSADPLRQSFLKSKILDHTPLAPMSPLINGFMWNDFTVFASEPGLGYMDGRGFVYGKSGTRIVLDASAGAKARVRGVFRAHQHSSAVNPMMRRLVAGNGLFRHWHEHDSLAKADATAAVLRGKCKLEHNATRPLKDGSVWTFNVAPDSYYGRGNSYKFDTYGVLSTGEAFADWKLRVVYQIVPALKPLPAGQ